MKESVNLVIEFDGNGTGGRLVGRTHKKSRARNKRPPHSAGGNTGNAAGNEEVRRLDRVGVYAEKKAALRVGEAEAAPPPGVQRCGVF